MAHTQFRPPGLRTITMMCWRFLVIFFGSCVIGIGVALLAAFIMRRSQITGGADEGVWICVADDGVTDDCGQCL